MPSPIKRSHRYISAMEKSVELLSISLASEKSQDKSQCSAPVLGMWHRVQHLDTEAVKGNGNVGVDWCKILDSLERTGLLDI
jgi:hypothetical protein